MHLPRSLLRFLAFTGMVTATVLGGNLAPSSAHVQTLASTVYNQGHGSFTATAVLNNTCATYSDYSASLSFHHLTNPVTASVSSNAGTTWGEHADGTYTNIVCPGWGATHGPPAAGATGSGGQAISGFTGTLSGTGVSCTLGSGTYTRGHFGTYDDVPPGATAPFNHPELNIAFVFSTVSGTGCPSTPVILKTTIEHQDHQNLYNTVGPYTTTCNSPIAPVTCNLDHQEDPSAW
jgi:hypothetical protein